MDTVTDGVVVVDRVTLGDRVSVTDGWDLESVRLVEYVVDVVRVTDVVLL